MFILFFIVSFVVGYLGLRFLDPRQSLTGAALVVVSLMLGMTLMGYAVLIFSLITKSMVWASLPTPFLLLVAALILRKKLAAILAGMHGAILQPLKLSWWEWFMIALGLIIFFLVSLQSMLWDKTGMPYSIVKGWGDGAYHFSMVQRFIQMDQFSLVQPVLSGHPLTYPFFVNFLTALLVRLGLPLPIAWHAPTVVFGLGTLVMAWHWARQFLNRKILAYLFVFLMVCGAGLGFLWLVKNIATAMPSLGLSGSLAKYLNHSFLEYSHLDVRTGGKSAGGGYPANIVWVVPLISFFSHQRSFMLGAGIGLLLLYGLFCYFYEKDSRWPKWLVLFSFLPLMHLHTFIALVILVGGWLVVQYVRDKKFLNKEVFVWGAITFILTIVPAFWLAYGVIRDSVGSRFFLKPWFGWMMCTHTNSWLWCDPNVSDTTLNVFWFWFKNFGLVFIVWVASLLINALRVKESRIKDLIWPSLVLFILSNLFLFQPWEFDNNKILFWWWVSAIVLALSLFDLPQVTEPRQTRRSRAKAYPHSFVYCVFLIVFVIFASFSGVFDIFQRARLGWQIQPNTRNFAYYDALGIAVGRIVKVNTGTQDIILTSHSPNTPVTLLAGRQLYLGYPGWLWTQGKQLVLQARQKVVETFLKTGEPTALCREGVKYWVIDDQFFRDYPVSVAPAVWENTELVDAAYGNGTNVELRKLICGL